MCWFPIICFQVEASVSNLRNSIKTKAAEAVNMCYNLPGDMSAKARCFRVPLLMDDQRVFLNGGLRWIQDPDDAEKIEVRCLYSKTWQLYIEIECRAIGNSVLEISSFIQP